MLCFKNIIPICFFIVVIAISFNIPDKGRYYLKDQWYTSSSKFFPVKANPRQVTEYYYPGVDSISKRELGKFGSYDQFTYDIAGNLLARKLYFDEKSWDLFKYTYTDSGYKIVFQVKSRTKLTETLYSNFKIVAGGKYQEIKYPASQLKDITIYEYRNNGDEILTIRTEEGKGYKSVVTVHSFYNGTQLIKKTMTSENYGEKEVSTNLYYYATDNSLDSIITRSANSLKRDIFIKNEYRDPLSEIRIENNDTSVYNTYTYLYDAKSNWIRRVEEDHLEDKFYVTKPKHALIIREINY